MKWYNCNTNRHIDQSSHVFRRWMSVSVACLVCNFLCVHLPPSPQISNAMSVNAKASVPGGPETTHSEVCSLNDQCCLHWVNLYSSFGIVSARQVFERS